MSHPIAVSTLIDQAVIDDLVLKHVDASISRQVAGTKLIDEAIGKAMKEVQADLAPKLAAAVEKGLDKVLNDPTFIAKLIGDALLKDSSVLAGSFHSALRAAGKKLALDEGTLGHVVESVTEQIAIEAAVRAADFEAKGGGQFS